MAINKKITRNAIFEKLKDKDPYLYTLLRERFERAKQINNGSIIPLKSEKKYITTERIYGIRREYLLKTVFDYRTVDCLMSWVDTPEEYDFWDNIKNLSYTNQETKEMLDKHFFRPYNQNKTYNLWI